MTRRIRKISTALRLLNMTENFAFAAECLNYNKGHDAKNQKDFDYASLAQHDRERGRVIPSEAWESRGNVFISL